MGLHPLSCSLHFRLRAGVLPSLRAQHCVTEGGGGGLWAALSHLWHPSDAARSWHGTFQPSTALECGHAVQSCPDELLCTSWALQGSPMELAGRFYTLELLPGQSLSSFVAIPLLLPGRGEAEAGAVVAPALAPPLPVTSIPKHHASSMCLWHQGLLSPRGFCPCRAA